MMNGFRHPMFGPKSGRTRCLVFCAAVSACLIGRADLALAQSVQGPPPLLPPQTAALPTGAGALTLDQWLLSPSLGVSSFYDSNVYSSSAPPITHGPGFDIHPSLLAEFNTGIFDTSLYGNIDSKIYPTLDPLNDTFNRQAGFVQKYSPLPDLIFTAQGNYTHNTYANVLVNSTTPAVQAVPSPIISPANPATPGAAGVVAGQQVVVSPNDTYTVQGSAYKEFNRAFATLGGALVRTIYETTPSFDYNLASYNGGGGIWFTPLLYAFANGAQSLYQPAVGVSSVSYFARGGIGSDRIGLFQGSIYGGNQGTTIANGGGAAGGDLYGGTISYFPTDVWTMSLEVDRLRNISNITSATNQALGGFAGGFPGASGLSLSGIGLSTNQSTQITTISYRSNYAFSPQTSAFAVASVTPIDYLGTSQVAYTWFAALGIRHQLRDDLTLTFDYNYSRYLSGLPTGSFNRDFISIGAIYTF